jgi:lipoate-protein ligase A
MAVDEALARACDEGAPGFPVVRFYWWTLPTLSLGAKERLREAADIEACRRLGIALVRRPTGGRAVLHDRELTYSVIAPLGVPPFDESVESSYRVIAEAMRAGFAELGIELELTAGSRKIRPTSLSPDELTGADAAERVRAAALRHLPCFAAPSRYELAYGGRKVVGSAQRRLRNAVLQHGSILLRSDPERLAEASGTDRARLEELEQIMTGLEEISGRAIAREELIEPLLRALRPALHADLPLEPLSADEERRVRELLPAVNSRLSLPDA